MCPCLPVLFFANELDDVTNAEHELVLDEWHPRIIVEFYHGARIEEVKLADLRGKNGETIALRNIRNIIGTTKTMHYVIGEIF